MNLHSHQVALLNIHGLHITITAIYWVLYTEHSVNHFRFSSFIGAGIDQPGQVMLTTSALCPLSIKASAVQLQL
jgi:hypothetical protein